MGGGGGRRRTRRRDRTRSALAHEHAPHSRTRPPHPPHPHTGRNTGGAAHGAPAAHGPHTPHTATIRKRGYADGSRRTRRPDRTRPSRHKLRDLLQVLPVCPHRTRLRLTQTLRTRLPPQSGNAQPTQQGPTGSDPRVTLAVPHASSSWPKFSQSHFRQPSFPDLFIEVTLTQPESRL